MTSPASGGPKGTTTAAIPGRSSAIGPPSSRAADAGRTARPGPLADRHRHLDQAGDAAREVFSDSAADVDAASAGPALRRPPHRPRRLPGRALLLRCLLPAG